MWESGTGVALWFQGMGLPSIFVEKVPFQAQEALWGTPTSSLTWKPLERIDESWASLSK